MIEELENHRVGYGYGYGGPTREEIMAKINEIIRYLNEKEKKDGDSTTNP